MLNFFNKLRPISFRYINDKKRNLNDKKIVFGILAQDIEKAITENGQDIKEYSILNKDQDGFLSVDYIQLIPILIAKIKDLEKRIIQLEKK